MDEEKSLVNEEEKGIPSEDGEKNKEENIESLPEWAKARMSKLEEERDNYKKGLLSKKLESKTLKAHEPKKEPEKTTDARREAISVVEESNEKQAIEDFIEKYPQFSDGEKWKELVSNYMPKNGKSSIKSILSDLERARKLVLIDSGELENEIRTNNENDSKQYHANIFSGSKTSSKINEKETLPKSTLEMARKMGVNEKDLKNVSNVINIV